MHSEQELVKGCNKFSKDHQEAVYRKYAPVLKGICLRYAKDRDEAEDILQEGFIKIFSNIKKFQWQGEGSFVYWMKRVMVNTAITYYNKYTKRVKEVKIEDSILDDEKNPILAESGNPQHVDTEMYNAAALTREEMMKVLNSIPIDFKVVFSMYVIEGYSHKEIAENLKIKEETSRTRLLRAKKVLKEAILKLDSSIIKDYR